MLPHLKTENLFRVRGRLQERLTLLSCASWAPERYLALIAMDNMFSCFQGQPTSFPCMDVHNRTAFVLSDTQELQDTSILRFQSSVQHSHNHKRAPTVQLLIVDKQIRNHLVVEGDAHGFRSVDKRRAAGACPR